MLLIEPRPPGAPARVWRDWLLVGVLAPAAVLDGLLRTDLPNAPAEIVLAPALLPALLWRRTRPLPMLAMVAVPTTVAPMFLGYQPQPATGWR
jgi:hypothetical protein